MRMASVAFAIGIGILLLSVTAGVNAYMAAFIVFPSVGTMLLHPLLSLANLFPESPGTVNALLNGCFDASSVVFLVMSAMVNAGVAFDTVLIAYLCGPVLVVSVFSLVLWPPRPFQTPESGTVQAAAADGRDESSADSAAEPAGALAPASSVQASASSQGKAYGGEAAEGEGEEAAKKAAGAAGDTGAAAEDVASGVAVEVAGDEPSAAGKDDAPTGFVAQITSAEFILLTLFMTQNFVRFNTYLGSVDAQVRALTDDPVPLVSAFGVILPVGATSVVIAGAVIDRLGLSAAAACLSALALLVNGLAMVPVPGVQYATFILFAVFRAFLFSFLTTYVAFRFGFASVGRLLGVISVLGGCVSFVQYPLLAVALEQSPVSFAIPNGILLATGAIAVLYPVYLFCRFGWLMPSAKA